MTEQPSFVHTHLEYKLQELLAAALGSINNLSKEDVLQCDNGCLTEIIRQFAVAPPILRSDLMVADEKVIEISDMFSDRRTGDTVRSFFIPVERNAEWLEDVSTQRATIDGPPLAFLDKERARIDIRLTISPTDAEGTLQRKLEYRKHQVEQYVDSVDNKVTRFNEDLAKQMAMELNTRKSATIRAERELENIGLPRVHNPEHAERAVQIERLLQNLGGYTNTASSLEEAPRKSIRSFIVHGHDDASLYDLKDYLQNTLKLAEPVVLRQMPSLGKTMMEKFEREAGATELIFVLLTPDDKIVDSVAPNTEKRRARQNVILELGFFSVNWEEKAVRFCFCIKAHSKYLRISSG